MSYTKPFQSDFGVYIVYNNSPDQILLRFERHEVRKLVAELNSHIKRRDNQKPPTCPKSDTWFADGGRCGWAPECNMCPSFGQTEKQNEGVNMFNFFKKKKSYRIHDNEMAHQPVRYCESQHKLWCHVTDDTGVVGIINMNLGQILKCVDEEPELPGDTPKEFIEKLQSMDPICFA